MIAKNGWSALKVSIIGTLWNCLDISKQIKWKSIYKTVNLIDKFKNIWIC